MVILVVLVLALVMVGCVEPAEGDGATRVDDSRGDAREDGPGKCSLVGSTYGVSVQCPDDHPYDEDLALGYTIVLGDIQRGAGFWHDADELGPSPRRHRPFFQYWHEGYAPQANHPPPYGLSNRFKIRTELPPGDVVIGLYVPPGFDVARYRVSLGDAALGNAKPFDVHGYVTEWTRVGEEHFAFGGIGDRYRSGGDSYYVSVPFTSSGETAVLQRLGYTYTLAAP